MKRILVVFGTRPESLKLWPIIKLAREEYAEDFYLQTYFTNQSEEQYIADIKPDWSARKCCGTMRPKGFGQILSDVEWFLDNRNGWDAVMVQGDTFSTLAGAQAAYFRDVPVIHVEAGLRTYRKNPWPEEMIRSQVDVMSQWRFAPTIRAKMALGYERLSCQVVGNTIIDRIKMESLPPSKGALHVLCQLHRRESWEKFAPMMEALASVIRKMPFKKFIFLSHPNGKLDPFLRMAPGNVRILPHQEYRPFLELMNNSEALITDSGGLIEEAAYFGKPCFILRDETERMESVEAGLAKLLGRGKDISAIPYLMETLGDWFKPEAPCPYGEGQASRRILDHLKTCSWSN